MNITYEEVKKYLLRYREAMKELSILADQIATLRSKSYSAIGCGINTNDAGKCSNHKPSDPLYEQSMQLFKLEEENRKALKETSKLERETTKIIMSVLHDGSKYKNELIIMLSIYIYFTPEHIIIKELNLSKQEYKKSYNLGIQLTANYLIEQGIIIPLQLNNGLDLLLYKLTN